MKQAPEERPDGRGLRVAVLRARFNARVVDGLLEGARSALGELGVSEVALIDVPGAFELPLAAKAAGATGRFDAIVALGAVIRGDTDHYEHVARESAAGLQRAALDTDLPVAFGVLTVAKEEQALRRARPGPENKGAEAARAAVAMALALRALRQTDAGRAQRKRGRRGKTT